MEKYKGGNSVKLVVKSDDEKLIDVSKIFLKDIEERFNEFKDNYEKEFKRQNKYLDHGDFVFLPERLSKKSPMTLINAPWGTGKTYFIENFVKLFIDEKIKLDIFKKIIIIDAWKFSNSRDVPMEFAAELSNILVNLQTHVEDVETKKSLVKKLFGWMNPRNLKLRIGVKIVGLIDIYSDIESKVEKETKEVEDNWKLIEDNKSSTIIFVDNIERLGSYTWDLLKSIIKLQEFSNYLIVLPLNIEKLANNSRTGANSEYPIEKYIDFNYYNFIQDYDGFFKTHIPDDIKWISDLNVIFNTELDNKKLSIRELEALFKKYKIFKIDNKYEQLASINQNIWPVGKTINKVIERDVDIFFGMHKEIFDVVIEAIKELKIYDNKGKLVNFPDEEFDNQLFFKEGHQRLYYFKDKDYVDVLEKINKELKKTKNFYKRKIKECNAEIKKTKDKINEFSKSLMIVEEKVKDYEKNDINFNEMSRDATSKYDEKKHSENSSNLSNARVRVENLKNTILQNEEDVQAISNDLALYNLNTDKQLLNVDSFIKKIKEIKFKCPLEDYQFNYINKFIDNVMAVPKTLDNEAFELDDIEDINKFWEIIK
jgi:hypothetical protein